MSVLVIISCPRNIDYWTVQNLLRALLTWLDRGYAADRELLPVRFVLIITFFLGGSLSRFGIGL